ncbi:MAG: SprT family zinc-dependent metalloprotease [Candidatus Falkowbacteria bacterium]|nr:SprT family zinc-dependent metalloprotease [Candidatus Falkowbacteria bacterium]
MLYKLFKISNKTKILGLNSGNLTYISRMNPRARHLRLALHNNGEVILTRPRYVSEKYATAFLLSKGAWLEKQLAKIKNSKNFSLLSETKAEYSVNQAKARAVITERLSYLNAVYNFKYKSISIRNQKTRWGSCSRRGGLSFNYRLIFFSPQVIDYVIAHELCHLKEFNHSKKFWDLVARAIPDYKKIRRELKNQNLTI